MFRRSAIIFSEVKHKLLDELAGPFAGRRSRPSAARERTGDAARGDSRCFAYPGDCGHEIFDACAADPASEACCCSSARFVLPGGQVSRAREYAHIHLDDILDRADKFENEALVLTHFSQRYRPEEIRQALRRIPEPLASRVVAFLPPV